MSFDTTWLDLREPADLRARDRELLAVAARFADESTAGLIMDLGAGTGSTMRAFPPSDRRRWRLVDYDATLLREAGMRGGEKVETMLFDLARVEDLPLHAVSLVTASALFDLVSNDWIDVFADRVAKAGIGVYAALSYDGLLSFEPPLPEDPIAIEAFNRHQKSDKGFGRAAGPDGGMLLAQAMRRRGYTVQTADSAWQLGAQDAALAAATLEGIAVAAGEAGMQQAPAWLNARREKIFVGTMTVGHVDVLALPAR